MLAFFRTSPASWLLILFGILPSTAFQSAGAETVAADYQTLVEAQQKFAAYGREHSIKESFTKFLPDAYLFRDDKFVLGGPFYAAQSERPGRLTWRPTYARIAASGDWGITTGPVEFHPNTAAEPPVGYGNFVTVWQKDASGTWQVAYDGGISYSTPAVNPDIVHPKKFAVKLRTTADTATLRSSLQQAEAAFTARAQSGMQQAYTTVLPEAGSDLQLLREKVVPYVGPAARRLATEPGPAVSFRPFQAGVAASGEVGYTLGYLDVKEQHGHYLRVWQREGRQWKLALELLSAEL
ncbi:nuclear transport factor 2 family protein [Hymenobacter tibetensis]|uniref:Nuclear transport factor 2 family protein n=1 Tax=Hymenobacter tibetensis TaxID=497967 RepID=A0ABY4CZ26_9BACT|nr:nuclear transport factor 2 family protein [Hymenobacter tibetensis]UOG74430.1 nuclear transport factor 2 family protein [Hymenobacter tibetensis]